MNYYGGDLYPSRGGGGGGSMKAVFLGVVGLAVYGARWWFYSWIAEARRSKQRMQPLWLADKELRCPDIQEESEAKTRSKLFESIDYTLLIHLVGTSTYIPPSLSSSTSDVPAMSGMTSGRSVYSGEMLIEFTLKKENASIALEKGISLNFSGGVIQGLWVNGKHIAADGLALQSPGLFSSLFHHHEPIQWRRHRLYIPGEWLTHTQRNRVFVSFVNGFDHAAVGMQRTTDARDNEEYLFADGRLYEAHRIFPCFDQPDLQGTFTLTVAAPPNAYVVTNTQVKTVYRDTVEYTLKTRQEETPNVDESLPPSFIDDVPRPSSFFLAVGRFQALQVSIAWGGNRRLSLSCPSSSSYRHRPLPRHYYHDRSTTSRAEAYRADEGSLEGDSEDEEADDDEEEEEEEEATSPASHSKSIPVTLYFRQSRKQQNEDWQMFLWLLTDALCYFQDYFQFPYESEKLDILFMPHDMTSFNYATNGAMIFRDSLLDLFLLSERNPIEGEADDIVAAVQCLYTVACGLWVGSNCCRCAVDLGTPCNSLNSSSSSDMTTRLCSSKRPKQRSVSQDQDDTCIDMTVSGRQKKDRNIPSSASRSCTPPPSSSGHGYHYHIEKKNKEKEEERRGGEEEEGDPSTWWGDAWLPEALSTYLAAEALSFSSRDRFLRLLIDHVASRRCVFLPLLSSSPFIYPSTYAWLIQHTHSPPSNIDLFYSHHLSTSLLPSSSFSSSSPSTASPPAFSFSSYPRPPSSSSPLCFVPPDPSYHPSLAAPSPSSFLPVVPASSSSLFPPPFFSSFHPAPYPPTAMQLSRPLRPSLPRREGETSSPANPWHRATGSPSPTTTTFADRLSSCEQHPSLSLLPSDLALPHPSAVYSSTEGVDSVLVNSLPHTRAEKEEDNSIHTREQEHISIPLTSFPLYVHHYEEDSTNPPNLSRVSSSSSSFSQRHLHHYPSSLHSPPGAIVSVYAVIHAAAGLTTNPGMRRELLRSCSGKNQKNFLRDERIERSLHSQEYMNQKHGEEYLYKRTRPRNNDRMSQRTQDRRQSPSAPWKEKRPSICRRDNHEYSLIPCHSYLPHLPSPELYLSRVSRHPIYHCASYTETLSRPSRQQEYSRPPVYTLETKERNTERGRQAEGIDGKEGKRGQEKNDGNTGEEKGRDEEERKDIFKDPHRLGEGNPRELRSCSTTAVLKLQRQQLDHMRISDDSSPCDRNRRKRREERSCKLHFGSRYFPTTDMPPQPIREEEDEEEEGREKFDKNSEGKWREGEQEQRSKCKSTHRGMRISEKRERRLRDSKEDTYMEKGRGRAEEDEEKQGERDEEEDDEDESSFLIEDAVIWQWFHRHIKQWAYTADSQATTHPLCFRLHTTDSSSLVNPAITVGKGACLLRQCCLSIGRNNFIASLRRYVQLQHRYFPSARCLLHRCLSMTSDTSLPVSSCPRITKKDLDLKKEREEEQRNVFAKHTPHTHSARLSLPDRRHLDTSQPSSQTSSYSVPPHSEGDEKNRKTSQQTSSSLAIALRQPSGSKSHLHPSEEEKNSTLDKERESKDLSMKKPVLPLAILLGRWWGGSGVKILKPVWIASTPRMFSSLDYNLPIPFPTSSRVYRQPHPVGDQSGTRLFSPFVTSYGQQPQGPSNRLTTLHPFFYPSARQWNPHLSRSPSPSPLNLYNVSPSLEFSRCFPSSKKSLIISSFHLFQFDSSLPRLPEGGREEDEEEASPMTTTSSRSIPTARFKPGERTKSSITRSSTHALPFQKIPIDCFFTGVVGTSELKKTKKTNEEEEEEEEVSPEVRRIWVTCVTEKMTRLRELIHSPSPLAVLCNPTDELYILPYIDDGSQAFLLPSLPNLSSSSLHRLLVCAALWTRVKETRLPADVFILQMLHVTERETEILLLSCICHFVRTALLYFIPDSLFHSIASVVNKTSLLRAAGGESLCDFLSNYSNYRHSSSSSSSSRNTGMCFPSSSSSTKNPRLYPVPAASSSSSFLSSSSISPYDHVVPPQQNPTSSVSESRRPEKRPPRFSSTSSTSPSDRKDKKQLEGLPPPTTTTTSDKHLSTSLISPSSAPPPHVLLLPSSVRAFWLDVAIETAFDATSILQLLHLLQLQDLCLGRLSVIHSLQRQIRRNRERLRTLTLLRWENQAMRRTRIEDEKHIKIRKGEKNSSSSSPSLPKDQHLQKRFSLVFPVLPGFSSPSTSSSSPLKRKKRRATDRDPYTSKSNRPRNSIETRSSISSLPPRQGQTRRSRVEDIYEEEDDGDVSLSSSSSSFSLSPEEKIPPNIASRDKHLHKTERHRNHLSDKNGEEKQSLKRPHSYRKNRTQTKKKKRSCFQDRRDFLQPPSWRFISNTPKIPYLLKSSSLLTPHDTNPHTHSSSSHHHPAPPSFPLLPCCSLVATALCRDCLKLQESELPSSRTKKKDKKKKKKIDRQLLLSPSTQLLQQEAENNTRLFSKQTENHQLSSSALPCNLALSIKPLPSSSRKEHRMENDGNKDGDSRREAHEERSNSLLSYMRDGEEKNGNDGAEPSHQGPSQNEEQEGEEEEEVFLSNSSSPAKRRNAGAGEGKEEDEEGKSFYRDDDVQDEKANTGCLYTREKHQDDCEEDFEAAGYSFPSFVTLDNEALKPQGEEREHDIYDQMKEEEQERHEEQEEAEDKLSCLSRSDEGSEPEERNLSPPQSFFDVPPISIATESRTSPHAPPENRSEVVERINSREEKEVIGEKKDDMKTSCVDSSKVEREGDSSLCPSNEEDEQGRNLRLDQLLQEKKDNNPSEETKEASEEKQEENVDENQERIDGGGTQEERSVTKIADDVYEQNKKPRFYDGKGSEETERRRWRRKEQKEHIEEEEKRRSLYPTPTEGQFLTSPLRAGRPPPSLPSSSSNFPSVSGNPPQLGKNDFPHPSSASSSASSSSSFSSLPLPMTCSSSSFSLKDKKGEEVDQNGGARCSLRDQQKAGNLLDSKTFTCPPSSSSCVHTAAASPLYTESHSSSEGEEEKGIRGEEHGVYFSSSWSSSSFSPTTSSLEPTTSEESTDSLSKEHTDTSTDTASSSPSSCFSHSHRVHRSRKPQDRQMSSFSSSLFIENHLPIYFTVCTADLLKGCSPHAQGSGIPHNPLSLHKQNTVANRGRTNTSAPPDVYCYNCGHGFHFSTYLRPSEMQGSGKKKKKKEKTKKRINKGRPFALLLSKGRHEDTMRKSEALWLLEEDDWATVEDSLPNQTHERRSGASLPKRRERKKAEEVSTTSYREEANTGEQASMESRGRIETEKESEEKREVEDERDDVFFMERKWQQEEEEKKKKEEKEEERDSMTEVREVSDPNQGDGYVSPSDQRNRQGRSNHSIRPSTESILHHYIHILDETGNTDGVLLRVSHQNLPPGLLFQAPLLTQQQRWKILERLFACRDSDLYARAPPSHMNSTASLSFTSTGDQVKKNTADSSSCSPLGGWEREGSTKDLGWSDGEPRQRWVRMNRFLSLQEKEAKENKDYRENALEEEEEKEKKMQDSWRQAKNRLLNIETTLRDTNIVRQATAIARCHSAVPSIECKEAHWYHFLDPPPPSSPIFPSFSASLAAFYQRMPGHKEILSPTFEESFFSCIFRVYLQLPRSSAHALWTHLFPFHFPTRKTLQRTKVLFLKVQRELKKRTQSMLDVPREEESAVSGNKRNDRSKTEIPSPSPSRHKSDSDTRRMKVDHDADKRTGKEDAEKAEGNAEDSNRRGGGERRRKVEGEGLRLMKEEEEAEEGGEGQEEDQITIGERKGDASYYKIGRSPYTSRETNSTRQTTETSRSTEEDLHKKEKEKEKRKSMKKSSLELAKVESEKNALWCLLRATAEAYARLTLTVKCQDLVLGNYYHNVP